MLIAARHALAPPNNLRKSGRAAWAPWSGIYYLPAYLNPLVDDLGMILMELMPGLDLGTKLNSQLPGGKGRVFAWENRFVWSSPHSSLRGGGVGA